MASRLPLFTNGTLPAVASPPTFQMQLRRKKMMMMHMTFYWGKDALILFSGFPGRSTSLYVLSLFSVFFMSLLVEFLSVIARRFSNPFAQTLVYVFRVGLAYLVMLAIMSFNAGVLLVAVVGHGLGFFLFSRCLLAFKTKRDGSMDGAIGGTC